MTVQTVNVKLPRTVYRRLERLAVTMHQSLDRVLAQTIRGNLPPSLDDVPASLRSDLAGLFDLSDDDLWAVARGSLDAQQWQAHQRLLRKNEAGQLTERERARLEYLRAETDRYVARKSFALALLKWRGYTLPILPDEAKRATA
jgi:predicted transcriptional regulator